MFKKIVLIFAILLSLLISCGKIAYAETNNWARVLADGVYLYATEDAKQKLFELEKSYYVNVIEETDNMYRVAVMPENNQEFVQIIGWVQKKSVSTCSAPVEYCYPTVKLTVIGESVDLKHLPDPTSQASCSIVYPQQMCYYGSITSYGKTWYYVRYAARFGYVEASFVTEPNIALHPTPLPQSPDSSVPSTTTPSTDTTYEPPTTNSPTSEILLIVFIVVLAVGLTLALFLPGNFRKRSNVFEQDI